MSFFIKAQKAFGTNNGGGKLTIQSQNGQSEMNDELTKVLTMLAQRNHPEVETWFRTSYDFGVCYICHICNQEVKCVVGNLRRHGEGHAKTSNLLPFL